MIQVHHSKKFHGGIGPDPAWPAEYHHVANVDIADADYAEAFRLTNTIESYWWDNQGVYPQYDSPAFRESNGIRGTRSTSVGDVIVLSDGRVMRCASVGWVSLPPLNREDTETCPACGGSGGPVEYDSGWRRICNACGGLGSLLAQGGAK